MKAPTGSLAAKCVDLRRQAREDGRRLQTRNRIGLDGDGRLAVATPDIGLVEVVGERGHFA